jgi:hypothetical protein
MSKVIPLIPYLKSLHRSPSVSSQGRATLIHPQKFVRYPVHECECYQPVISPIPGTLYGMSEALRRSSCIFE